MRTVRWGREIDGLVGGVDDSTTVVVAVFFWSAELRWRCLDLCPVACVAIPPTRLAESTCKYGSDRSPRTASITAIVVVSCPDSRHF